MKRTKSSRERRAGRRGGRVGLARRVHRVEAGGERLVSTGGGVLLVETARTTGLDVGLVDGLGLWQTGRACHRTGKVVLDLATAVAAGGTCLADAALVRAQQPLFGPAASEATTWRAVDRLAAAGPAALGALRAARARARAVAWALCDPFGPDEPVTVDVDATLVAAHSEKEDAAATFKRGFGLHPIGAWVDHGGPSSSGEALAVLLRPGNAGANDAADHETVLGLALEQLPETHRGRVLVRADGGGGTKRFRGHVTGLGLQYSVTISSSIGVDTALVDSVQPGCWAAALDGDGSPRDGAQVAELTGLLPALQGRGWPAGMRVIARRERPHPGAQLRLTDKNGWRVTLFATNSPLGGPNLQQLEVRHRRRGHAEHRVRDLKDTGLGRLPFQTRQHNAVWAETCLLACDLLAWTALLGLDHHAAAQPKTLRLRLLGVAARLVTTGRRRLLKVAAGWPWTRELVDAHRRLAALPAPT